MSAPIAFLDFDGVLHPADVRWREGQMPALAEQLQERHSLFEHALLLVNLLEPYPSVQLILSTAWVRLYGLDTAASLLPKALQARIVGATFEPERDGTHFTDVARGYQVLAEAKRRRLKTWIALDDDALDWPRAHKKRLVATDPVLGLSHPSAQAALKAWLESRL